MQKFSSKYNCIVVLGTTASGKTHLACQLAHYFNGEIISADSRQVYKHLNIGTGKDLIEYQVEGKNIPYHLIDCCEPEDQFYLHNFVEGLQVAFDSILQKEKLPIVCGGTGLYLDALRKDFSFTSIKEDIVLREELKDYSKEELIKRLNKLPKEFIKHIDTNSLKRLIRGIEVAEYRIKNNTHQFDSKKNEMACNYNPLYIGIECTIEQRKQAISKRLESRLNNGLIEEVEKLLQKGITHERLQKFGLEYKFVSNYLNGHINNQELFEQLRTSIFQFAKRQATWFRKMEKEGVEIHWVNPNTPMNFFENLM